MIPIDPGGGGYPPSTRVFPKWNLHQPRSRNIQWSSSTKIMGNTFKTTFLLTALTLLLMFIGRYFGGQNGMYPGAGLRRRHELRLVLLFRQDCAGYVSRSARHARATSARLRSRRAPHAENRHSDAEDLRDPHGVSQRLRHRTKSEPRLRRRDSRHSGVTD